MFQREIVCTAVAAHNIHESKHAGRVQEGGTGAISFGDATGYTRKVGKDEEGLGRWSWILFGGSKDHKTRIITAYNPCKNKIVHSGTSYQQQRQYFVTKKKDLTCPLIMFRQQLIKQLKKWRAEGDKILLFMDHNEHVYDRALRKTLSNSTGLNLQEVILQHTGTRTGATFFRGSKPNRRTLGIKWPRDQQCLYHAIWVQGRWSLSIHSQHHAGVTSRRKPN